MQTTIRVDEETLRLLQDFKSKEKLKSYDDVIKQLAKAKELSMFGADKRLKKWNEAKDRAKFR